MGWIWSIPRLSIPKTYSVDPVIVSLPVQSLERSGTLQLTQNLQARIVSALPFEDEEPETEGARYPSRGICLASLALSSRPLTVCQYLESKFSVATVQIPPFWSLHNRFLLNIILLRPLDFSTYTLSLHHTYQKSPRSSASSKCTRGAPTTRILNLWLQNE